MTRELKPRLDEVILKGAKGTGTDWEEEKKENLERLIFALNTKLFP